MPLARFSPPPGVDKRSSAYAAEGRWSDADKVRSEQGNIEKIGGWQKHTASTVSGVCRGLFAWRSNDDSVRVAYGTHTNLYKDFAGTLEDITPSGLTAGNQNASNLGGWGSGGWGRGFWGQGQASTIVSHARTWALDAWGEILIANPRGGSIYEWAPNSGALATAVTGAPTAEFAFVTGERHLVALGADGDPTRVEWSDQDDRTDWTASATNQAGGFTITGASRLISGIRLRAGTNLVFSETECYRMIYTGARLVFGFRQEGTRAGIIAPLARTEYAGVCYWMGRSEFWMYDGFVRQIPEMDAIRDYVFDDINLNQKDKFFAYALAEFGEVWFHYCSAASNEPDRYVFYKIEENAWYNGTMTRTAMIDAGVTTFPIGVDSAGIIYDHENGVDDVTAKMRAFIKSAMFDIGDGNRYMDIFGIVMDTETLVGKLLITLNTYEYPTSLAEQNGPYIHTSLTGRVDTRAGGRQADIQFESDEVGGNFRVGRPRLEVQASGARR